MPATPTTLDLTGTLVYADLIIFDDEVDDCVFYDFTDSVKSMDVVGTTLIVDAGTFEGDGRYIFSHEHVYEAADCLNAIDSFKYNSSSRLDDFAKGDNISYYETFLDPDNTAINVDDVTGFSIKGSTLFVTVGGREFAIIFDDVKKAYEAWSQFNEKM